MDKYEYQLKLDQINKLMEKNDYATALKIADNIDWRRVRSVNTLSKIADIYEKNEKYEESRDLLEMAYDRAPMGRMLAYRLSDVCIKLGDYDQAIDYYKDFVRSAPKDPAKLLLKYKIFRGKGAALKDQIAILEEYRGLEYEEQWALELAYLYQEAGDIEKCVNECDELILWFNDGQYVIKAMELKMQYAPLSPAQQEKYEIRMNRTKVVDTREEPRKAGQKAAKKQVSRMQEDGYSQGYGEDYARDYQQYDSYGQETEDVYGQDYSQTYQEGYGENNSEAAEEVYGETGTGYGMADGELPEIQEPEIPQPEDRIIVDADGQMTLEMPQYQPVEKQITGQMTIQEILAEWEKAKQPLGSPEESAVSEEQISRTEPVKDVPASEEEELPEESVGLTEEEELPEIAMPEVFGEPENIEDQTGAGEAASDKQAEQPGAEAVQEAEPQTARPAAEEEKNQPKKPSGVMKEEELPEEPAGLTKEEELPEEPAGLTKEEELPEIAMPEGFEEPGMEGAAGRPEAAGTSEEDQLRQEVFEPVDTMEAHEAEKAAEGAMPEEAVALSEEEELPEIAMPEDFGEAKEENAFAGGPAGEEELPPIELPEDFAGEASEGDADDDDAADDLESRIVSSLSRDSLALADADDGEIDGRIGEEQIRRPRPQRRRTRRLDAEEKELTEEQKKLFTYFAPVHGMSDQLWTALENEKSCIRGGTSNIGNVMITGEPGTGKTMLAVNLVKAIQKSRNERSGKLAKISAETLNEKDVAAVVKKLSGGALIIERASEMTNETAIRLEVAMRGQTGELLIIFEDDKPSLRRFMKMHPKLGAMCTTKIDIPVFNNDELVEFGKCYAYELEYSIDEMAVLALYNRIGNMQRDDYDVSVTDVKKIIDAAIEKNEKGGVGKFFSLLTKKRYDDDDCIILKEKDFEE